MPRTPAAHDAVTRLHDQIAAVRPHRPLPVPLARYVYLYLFAQWLRVSYPYKPRFLGPPIGWVRLVWRPIAVLAGRPASGAPFGTWSGFYHREWVLQTDKDIVWDATYRWVPTAAERAQSALDAQIDNLHRLCQRHACDPAMVVRSFDALGQPRTSRHATAPWHPYIILAIPGAWQPRDAGPSLVQQEAADAGRQLLYGPAATLQQWLQTIVPRVLQQPSAKWATFFYDHFTQLCETERDALRLEASATVFAAERDN